MAIELEAINAREKGQFPISISTSLALEGASGIYPERPESPAPFDTPPTELWVNVRTLFRNLLGSLKTAEDRNGVLPNALHVALTEEMTIVEAVVNKASQGRTGVVYYACDYTSLPRKYPKAQLKESKTSNQLTYLALEQQTLKLVMKEHGSEDLRHFDIELTGAHKDAWMISHLPVDLLSKSHFQSLKLLESHTGVLKGPSLWYTKLTNGKDLPHIPFGPFALQVFGDGGHHFQQMPRVIREEVLRLAEEYKWNATTTKDRISLSVRTIKDPMTRQFLLSLL